MLSVIIPARNEKYLQRTITDVLENAHGEIEVVAICDGYWPDPPIEDHPNVRLIHNTEPRGQRHSINDACRMARGKYMMKLDAHCAVGPGFDVILARDCEYDMTMIPEMYNLNIEEWRPRLFDNYDEAIRKGKVNPYMYIGWVDNNLRAQYYSSSSDRRKFLKRKNIKVDETMCCMGPFFFMHMDRFWELEGCDEGHGQWGQQGVEVACKAWLSGGRLMVNKNTWAAHWFRGSYEHKEYNRKGFPYSMRQAQVNKARAYSNDLWLNNKWHLQKRDFAWLLDKFNPPKWDGVNVLYPTVESRHPVFKPILNHIKGRKNDACWRGIPVMKYPSDMNLYEEVIYEQKPELIVEIGTKYGGSALHLQDHMDLFGTGGQVVTIDIEDQAESKDPRIAYLVGSSRNKEIIAKVHKMAEGKRTMLIVDGDHGRRSVKWDLHNYHSVVSPGQYLVVEDCYNSKGLWWPGEARDWFLNTNKKFEQTDRCIKYLVGVTMGGWLRKKEK